MCTTYKKAAQIFNSGKSDFLDETDIGKIGIPAKCQNKLESPNLSLRLCQNPDYVLNAVIFCLFFSFSDGCCSDSVSECSHHFTDFSGIEVGPFCWPALLIDYVFHFRCH